MFSVYLELLLGDIGLGWLQQLQDSRSDVSTTEVISSQSSEQNTLSLTAYLVANNVFTTTVVFVKDVAITNRILMNFSVLDCRCLLTDVEGL